MRAFRAALVLLLIVATSARSARIVDVTDVPAHVGSTVTVEGDVAAARLEPAGLVLELTPAGPKSFRAVLVLALISSLPRSPERIYEGKRVRITGLIQRFQGRNEMILESASQIEVIDLAGAPAAVTTTTSPSAPPTTSPAAGATDTPTTTPPPPAPTSTPPATAIAPIPAPAPVPVPAPAPSMTPTTSPAPPPPPPAAIPVEPAPRPLLGERLAIEGCERARTRWRDAAAKAKAAAADLTACLDADTFACREKAAKLAPAIADLEWAEQQVADGCY